MLRFVFIIWLLVVAALMPPGQGAAFAQSEKEKCATIAGPMMEASDSLASMVGAMLRVDYQQVAREFSGDKAKQFHRLDARQQALMPHMEAFLAELEKTAMVMRSCSR